MSEFEKLAYLIAEEFVRAFESMEIMLEDGETVEEQEQPARVMAAKA